MQLLIIACILFYRRKFPSIQYIPLLLIFGLIFLAYIIQTLFYGVSLVNLSIAMGVIILFFFYEKERIQVSSEKETLLLEKMLQVAQQETELARKDAQMAAIVAQLTEKRTQIMLSQIQPHFIYNALSVISFLCIKDPMKAKETTDNLADYLRTNLDSLRSEHMVPFSKELEHIRVYPAIEQTRFGEDLSVEYDIRYSEFLLPCLSVQPIVENAVRHGICGKEGGGTVAIRTRKCNGNILITVTDNGVGFDTDVISKDSQSHIGMENVMQRVKTLCGGELIVKSTPGHGTSVTIVIPDEAT